MPHPARTMTALATAGLLAAAALSCAAPAGATTAAGSATITSTLPNPTLTPGAVTGANQAQLCVKAPTATITAAQTKSSFARYHLDYRKAHTHYTVLRLIPASLGGTATARNLWPAPNAVLSAKRRVDSAVRLMVCTPNGNVGLRSAQLALGKNWTTAVAVLNVLRPAPTPASPAPTTPAARHRHPPWPRRPRAHRHPPPTWSAPGTRPRRSTCPPAPSSSPSPPRTPPAT